MTEEDKQKFDETRECYICKKPFTTEQEQNKNQRKVRDHNHLTGEFRGAAHSFCNIQMRKTLKIPVFFHNFRGYDSHLIVQALNNFPERKIEVIGQTMEKYLMLSWGDLICFKDSLQFLNCSLEQLAENLKKAG